MCRQLLTFAHVSLHELAADHADERGVRSIGHGPGSQRNYAGNR